MNDLTTSSPTTGGRSLRRTVQRYIEDPLSEEILIGRFTEGDKILADMEDGKFIFIRKEEVGDGASADGGEPKALTDAGEQEAETAGSTS